MNKKKIKEVLIVIAIVMLIGIKPVSGCICGGVSVEKAYEQSSMIFVGKVIDVKDPYNQPYLQKFIKQLRGEWRVEATFEVSASWKGFAKSKQVVYTDTSLCDFGFTLGKRFLVYAHEVEPNEFYSFKCYRTMSIEKADQDLLFLQRRSKFSQSVLPSKVQNSNLALGIFLSSSFFLLALYIIIRLLSISWLGTLSRNNKID